MKAIASTCAALFIIAASVEARDRPFESASTEGVLTACKDNAEWQQGFCLGFIEALAVRLAETREFCSYWPVNMEPIVAEALDALGEADKTAPAWQVIESRLSAKHLPPCK